MSEQLTENPHMRRRKKHHTTLDTIDSTRFYPVCSQKIVATKENKGEKDVNQTNFVSSATEKYSPRIETGVARPRPVKTNQCFSDVNMDERKIIALTLIVIIYGLYSVHVWFIKGDVNEKESENLPATQEIEEPSILPENDTQHTFKQQVKAKPIPLYFRNACSILQIFTEKPINKKWKETKAKEVTDSNNTITAIGVTVFLIVLMLNAILDVLKVKEEEKERRKLYPNGERRQSLAEFANKKTLRRESSKFGLQLFQIAESVPSSDEDKKTRRQTIPYTRGDSTNSYLREKNTQKDASAPASVGDMGEPKLVKQHSVTKLFGARPVPMVRRSSFPALPINPEIQAMMLGHKQPSVDSDDEDGRGRRVRIIRRF